MASLDILCSNLINLKNNITKIEHKKIFFSPSEIFKKYFMAQYMPNIFHDPDRNPPAPLQHN